MDYSPYFFPQEMQEYDMQGNSALPFAVAMEEEQGHSCSLYGIPQALAIAAASPGLYSSSTAGFTAHEQGFSYATMQTDHQEDIANVEIFDRHNNIVYSEPTYEMGCMTPSLPLGANNTNEDCLVVSAPDFPINEQNINYLLSLQSVLKCQYGISLNLDQLLALDVLPGLLQPEGDPQQPHHEDHNLHVKLELPPLLTTPHPHSQVHQVADHDKQAACLHVTIQDTSAACVSPIHMKHLCVNEAYRPQDISSPGSAASSSIVTENDNGEKVPLHAECIAPTSNLTPGNSQSWIDRSISWVPGGGHESSALQALSITKTLEACERPPQRRKLQGITLEQVLQAEKLQQINVASHIMKPITVSYDTSLMEVTNGRDVPASSSAVNGSRGGSFAAIREVQAVRERSHEIPRPLLQPKKPAATSVEPQSIAARHRRQRIKEKTEALGMIIPGATRLDTAGMFDLAIKYVHFLQAQMMCLENEMSFSSKQKMSYEDESVSAFRRALIHRLLSSQDVQHFLSKEGLCLVTESLASRLNFDGNSVLSKKAPTATPPQPNRTNVS